MKVSEVCITFPFHKNEKFKVMVPARQYCKVSHIRSLEFFKLHSLYLKILPGI